MKDERDDQNESKLGAGHLSAMARQGLRELRAAIYPESNIAQPPVYGIAGELTPGEIRDAKEPNARDGDEEQREMLRDRLQETDVQLNREQNVKEMERE